MPPLQLSCETAIAQYLELRSAAAVPELVAACALLICSARGVVVNLTRRPEEQHKLKHSCCCCCCPVDIFECFHILLCLWCSAMITQASLFVLNPEELVVPLAWVFSAAASAI